MSWQQSQQGDTLSFVSASFLGLRECYLSPPLSTCACPLLLWRWTPADAVSCGTGHDFPPARIADMTFYSGGHTNTERGYLPILASKLSSTLAEFANETHPFSQAVTPKSLLPHGPSGPTSPVTLTPQERQALRNIQVFVSEADGHPLERV